MGSTHTKCITLVTCYPISTRAVSQTPMVEGASKSALFCHLSQCLITSFLALFNTTCPALLCLPGTQMLALLWMVALTADYAGHKHDKEQYTSETAIRRKIQIKRNQNFH